MRTLLALLPGALLLAAPLSAQCETDRLFARGNQSGDGFGTSIHASKTRLVVSAPLVSEHGFSPVYVFERAASGWRQTAKIAPSDPLFGTPNPTFDEDGDWLVLGYPDYPRRGPARGRVYLFEHAAGTWSQAKTLDIHVPRQTAPRFGSGVAIDGHTLVISAPELDDPGLPPVFVYELQSGHWSLDDELHERFEDPGATFGGPLALDGDTLVVGHAPGGASSRVGAVWIFERTTLGWRETHHIVGSDSKPGDDFGSAIRLDGDTILVGATGNETDGPGVGAAYVLERRGVKWVETRLAPPSLRPELGFGVGLALDGDRAIVGSQSADARASGEVHLYARTGDGWAWAAQLIGSPTMHEELSGSANALADDAAFVGAPADGPLQAHVPGAVLSYSLPLAATVTPYCSCAVNAPCGNTSNYGGCANETGSGARLTACSDGSASTGELVLFVDGFGRERWGRIRMAAIERALPFRRGRACVASGARGPFRFPVSSARGTGAWIERPRIVAATRRSQALLGAIVAGRTWSFQASYRDPLGPCNGADKLTNALRIPIGP
ncbi:MAG: hypothetical protein E2O39_01500 [Planctomycetota bacterium]|nr:MAG: hypothetical protein E2O39_01500 [Planctomycetota bacterium]